MDRENSTVYSRLTLQGARADKENSIRLTLQGARVDKENSIRFTQVTRC